MTASSTAHHAVDTTPIETRLADGTPIVIRPLEPEDAALLVDGFARLSPESRYRRFLQAVVRLSPEQVAYLTHVDGYDHLAWGVTTRDPSSGQTIGIAIARSVREPVDAEQAEFAIAVADEWQGRGVGARLTRVLADRARRCGVTRWHGSMLASNTPIVRLLTGIGQEVSRTLDGRGTLDLVVRLPDVSPT